MPERTIPLELLLKRLQMVRRDAAGWADIIPGWDAWNTATIGVEVNIESTIEARAKRMAK